MRVITEEEEVMEGGIMMGIVMTMRKKRKAMKKRHKVYPLLGVPLKKRMTVGSFLLVS